VVRKLAGASGAELWRTDVMGTASGGLSVGNGDEGKDLVVNAAGDVFAVGYVDNLTTRRDAVVVRLDGATGAEIWHLELDGTELFNESPGSPTSSDSMRAVALLPSGDPVAVGELRD